MDKIITNFDFRPMPCGDYDWEAVRENYEPGDLVGYGKTEEEAIRNLIDNENEL